MSSNAGTNISAVRELGWALCDGTTPAHQEIFDAVLKQPTPVLNDGRFIKGVTVAEIGKRVDNATSLILHGRRNSAYTHNSVVVPGDGTISEQPDNKHWRFTGGPDAGTNNAGSQIALQWDQPEIQPKNVGLVYIILVK